MQRLIKLGKVNVVADERICVIHLSGPAGSFEATAPTFDEAVAAISEKASGAIEEKVSKLEAELESLRALVKK